MKTPIRRDFFRRISTMGIAGSLAGIADNALSEAEHSPNSEWPLTPAERAATVTPSNLEFAPGDVRRYGADPSGVRDSTQAFFDANSVGVHGGGSIRIPSGQYKYAPSSTLNIGVSWWGDGPHETYILCDTTKFSGEYFRMVGSTELRDLLIKATGPGKLGTGIRLAPVDAGQFTGHARLTRIWVLGFNYNIQCDNNFEITFDQVRSSLGNEGFYCAPEAGEGNGYSTSHVHLNCYYAENLRNVLYAPSIRYAFRAITFLGGAIEGATGNACQASFTRCSPLKFIQLYLEAAPRIPAVVLEACTASIDGVYMNGTGGIKVGSNTRVDLRQVITTTAGDVFQDGDGSQQVVMENCLWPAAGNTLTSTNVTLRNTSINGITYRDCTPESWSLGAVRFSRQTTLVNLNSPCDVYRFTGVSGDVRGGSLSGRFEIIARDKGDASNQSVYEYWIGSASGGARHASLVPLQRLVRGTDVGSSAQPLSVADDGDRGGLRLQFLKNSGIQQVIVDVLFHGLASST